MNVFGIGIDIIEIDRIQRNIQDKFLTRYFTMSEIADFKKLTNPQNRVAAYFAMKEAVLKSLGVGIGDIALKDVEILKNEAGKPYLYAHGKLLDLMNELNVNNIEISCSHSKKYAVANAVAICMD